MPEPEYDLFYLERQVVLSVVQDLRRSPATVDQRLSRYLSDFEARDTNSPGIVLLGMAALDAKIVRSVATDSAYQRRSAGAASVGPLNWGLQFIRQILAELREIICGPKSKRSKLGANSQAILSAIAAAIVAKFHVTSVTATGLSVLVFLALGRATKSAFCKMTDSEVLAALTRGD